MHMFGSDDEFATQVPTQAQTIVEGSGAVLLSEYKPAPDVDYLQVCIVFFFFLIYYFRDMGFEFQVHLVILMILFTSSQELLAIQQQGPRAIGFFGTRNMGFMHQNSLRFLVMLWL